MSKFLFAIRNLTLINIPSRDLGFLLHGWMGKINVGLVAEREIFEHRSKQVWKK